MSTVSIANNIYIANMILVKMICYVNVENHFLTFTKHITFTRTILGTPLTLFRLGGYQINTCLPFSLYQLHGFHSESEQPDRNRVNKKGDRISRNGKVDQLKVQMYRRQVTFGLPFSKQHPNLQILVLFCFHISLVSLHSFPSAVFGKKKSYRKFCQLHTHHPNGTTKIFSVLSRYCRNANVCLSVCHKRFLV